MVADLLLMTNAAQGNVFTHFCYHFRSCFCAGFFESFSEMDIFPLGENGSVAFAETRII